MRAERICMERAYLQKRWNTDGKGHQSEAEILFQILSAKVNEKVNETQRKADTSDNYESYGK